MGVIAMVTFNLSLYHVVSNVLYSDWLRYGYYKFQLAFPITIKNKHENV